MGIIDQTKFNELSTEEQLKYIKWLIGEPRSYLEYTNIKISNSQIIKLLLKIVEDNNYDAKIIDAYMYIIKYCNVSGKMDDEIAKLVKFIVGEIKKRLIKSFKSEEFVEKLIDMDLSSNFTNRFNQHHYNFIQRIVENALLEQVFDAMLSLNYDYYMFSQESIECLKKICDSEIFGKKFPFVSQIHNGYTIETLKPQGQEILLQGLKCKSKTLLKYATMPFRSFLDYCALTEYGGALSIKNKDSEIEQLFPILRNGNVLMIYTGISKLTAEQANLLIQYAKKMLEEATKADDNLTSIVVTERKHNENTNEFPLREFYAYGLSGDSPINRELNSCAISNERGTLSKDEIRLGIHVLATTNYSKGFEPGEVTTDYTTQEKGKSKTTYSKKIKGIGEI